jgi:triphosphatase
MKTVPPSIELELKFLAPASSRAALLAEMARGATAPKRISLAARYLDTTDRRLARAGIAWRLRREGRRWVQTLKTGGTNALERFEHEVVRPDASHDDSLHGGTAPGDKLISILHRAHADGLEVGVRFQTEVMRTVRTLRTRGAVVEVAFDQGWLVSSGSKVRIHEVEFELISGSATAMLALAERWRKRFGLIHDPRSKAERGDRLAQGSPFPPVRKAGRPDYPGDATVSEAFSAVLDECLAHITHNAVGLCEGDPTLRVEHVHQLRVGIRRLRSALRSFAGWTPAPAPQLVEGLRALFGTLGKSRDLDVLDSGVVASLAQVVGSPALKLPPGAAGPDPVKLVRSDETQQLILAWITWRTTLDGSASDEPTQQPTDDDEPTFHRAVERRLRQWHRRIVTDGRLFDELDDTGLHSLRKRVKRQHYAVEFFAPVLRSRTIERYLKPLVVVQDRMGELNDLLVARTRYQALVASEPAAWFALGWLAARIASARALALPELKRLAKRDPPRR